MFISNVKEYQCKMTNPDVVVLHVGTNDLGSATMEEMIDGMKELVMAVLARFHCRVVISGIMTRYDSK
jgi:hypothetical protein